MSGLCVPVYCGILRTPLLWSLHIWGLSSPHKSWPWPSHAHDHHTSLTEFRVLWQALSPCSASCLFSAGGREDDVCSSRLSISFLICVMAARRLAFCSCSFFISKVEASLLREVLSSYWNICKIKVQHRNYPLLMNKVCSVHNTHTDP